MKLNKKGQWQLLALLDSWVLLGIAIFILIIIAVIIFSWVKVIATALIITGLVLIFSKKVSWKVGIAFVGLGLVVALNPGDILSIVNPNQIPELSNPVQLANINNFGFDFENYASVSGIECYKSDRGDCVLTGNSKVKSDVYKDENNFVTLQSVSSQGNLDYTTEYQAAFSFINFSNVQEVIILMDGSVSAYRGRDSGQGQSASFGFGISDGKSLSWLYLFGVATNTNVGTTDSKTDAIQPTYFRVVNNYDGSYTSYTGIGKGDAWLKAKTVSLENPILYFCSMAASFAGGGSNAASSSSAQSNLRILNIITKEDELAKCSINQVYTGAGCVDSSAIFLAYEPALHESIDQAEQRINTRLDVEMAYYDKQIKDLQMQLSTQSHTEAEIASLQTKIAELEAKKPEIEEAKVIVIQRIIETKDVPFWTKAWLSIKLFFAKIF